MTLPYRPPPFPGGGGPAPYPGGGPIGSPVGAPSSGGGGIDWGKWAEIGAKIGMTALAAYQLYNAAQASGQQGNLQNEALGIARERWTAGAPLREKGMTGLLGPPRQVNLDSVYGDPTNPFAARAPRAADPALPGMPTPPSEVIRPGGPGTPATPIGVRPRDTTPWNPVNPPKLLPAPSPPPAPSARLAPPRRALLMPAPRRG